MKTPRHSFYHTLSLIKSILLIVSLTCVTYSVRAAIHLTKEQITGLIQIANATGADITISKGKHKEVFLHTDRKTSTPRIKEAAPKTVKQKAHSKPDSSSSAPEPREFASTAVMGNTASFVSHRLAPPRLNDNYFPGAPLNPPVLDNLEERPEI